MDTRLIEFAQRHTGSQDSRVTEAIRAIRSGAVTLRHLSEGVSSRELAGTYSLKSRMAEDKKRHAEAAEFLALARHCEENGTNPCRIWVLEGTEVSFAIFELKPAQTVAGCFRFPGSFGAVHDGA